MKAHRRSDGGMGVTGHGIFRAIREQKMLAVEYRNKSGQLTHYWVGIVGIDPKRRILKVRGMHLVRHTVMDLTMHIDAIQSSSVVEGTYFRTPPALARSIEEEPHLYVTVFGSSHNLKILDYLSDCSKLNASARCKDFALIEHIDEDSFRNGAVRLTDDQFSQIVTSFQARTRFRKKRGGFPEVRQIALNVLSLNTPKGLYVLAYRELRLDVEKRTLALGKKVTYCREFVVSNGRALEQQSIRRFLDESDLALLEAGELDPEVVRDRISRLLPSGTLLDDSPHVFELVRIPPVSLEDEYEAIARMSQEETMTYPLKAFFGDLLRRPVRRKDYPLVVLDNQANLDQLSAMYQALRYPLTYVQGPPGTGKTSTIVNTLVNAFLNGKTVLFSSYNNHPVDGVYKALASLEGPSGHVPFPILRLGNNQCVEDALNHIRELYGSYVPQRGVPVRAQDADGGEAGSGDRSDQTNGLAELLRSYEERVDLLERKECLERLLETNTNLNFNVALEGGQLADVERDLSGLVSFDEMEREATRLSHSDQVALMERIGREALRRIGRLREPRIASLMEIVLSEERDTRVARFNAWVAQTTNLKLLLRVFPVIATTNISARRLGASEPIFDMTIIDEASQCDTACALIPILRGTNLMLVGDPQQLNPVVTIDPSDNRMLRRTYQVPDEYDYVRNSVYKTFLSCDAVSNEILLHEHYRCDERIIEFSNKKYYAGKLAVRSGRHVPDALTFMNIEYNPASQRNTAPSEADAVVKFARYYHGKTIGVITPFSNQSELIKQRLRDAGLEKNVTCGTVHAFQGDEKDVVLFSLALTDKTRRGTYEWLCRNRELINVATSRARDHLIVISNDAQLDRLHRTVDGVDDIYELVQYVKSNGTTEVSPRSVTSRALGVKPYSTKTEAAFLETLNHALGTIFVSGTRHVVHHEVPIAQVFGENFAYDHLFYSGRFDFVVYEVVSRSEQIPVLAIELDGLEHFEDQVVRDRDRRKREICEQHGFQLIRVQNTYARRYHYIKDILERYFRGN